ncbi:MAG TPA: hypothetical protein VNN80_02475, partial [Polyangiaceae bacterium]|nr:hypothetical protein [Polyangiaceae bacterium]
MSHRRRFAFRSGHPASGLLALAFTLLACTGGGSHGRADAGSDDAGGPDAGGTAGAGSRPEIPPASFLGCSALAPTFSGTCDNGCASVRCECEPFGSSYVACHPERGCVTGLDCAVACERDLSDVVDCLGAYAPCQGDADCNGGRCVAAADGAGDCRSGLPGAACLDVGDCIEGRCVAVDLAGDRNCESGERGARCNSGTDCANGLACVLPASS